MSRYSPTLPMSHRAHVRYTALLAHLGTLSRRRRTTVGIFRTLHKSPCYSVRALDIKRLVGLLKLAAAEGHIEQEALPEMRREYVHRKARDGYIPRGGRRTHRSLFHWR